MKLQKQLREAGVQWVRILWCDHANVIRGKAPHISMLADGLPDGLGIAAAQLALPVMYDAVAPNAGLGPVGEAQMVPDWSTLKILPYAPGQAQVIGDLLVDGKPWAHCPREYLREQVKKLETAGFGVKAAFENEFFLLRKTPEGYEPADRSVYAATLGFNEHQFFINDFTAALEAQGLQPEFYYPESGPGQQELSIRYGNALEAADNQIAFRETARGVAHQHGLVASFLPKIYDNAAGSGCHINLSLWKGKQNLMGDTSEKTDISKVGQHFIAGVLAHIHGLTALTIPSRNSFRRIRPHFWAGAYRAWGYANREAAVRVNRGPKGATRFELKTADASANPYLALGAMLAAGLDGIHKKMPLAIEATDDPALLPKKIQQQGQMDLLPNSLGQAIEALQKDQVLMDSLGEARAKSYIAVRKMEWEALKDMSLEDEVKLLAERY